MRPVAVSTVTAAPRRCRSSTNCPGASRRPASPRCVRASPASSSSASSNRAASSSRATCSTGSIRRRSSVQVDSAEATLQRAKAVQLRPSSRPTGRPMRERNVASGQQLDNAVAALAQADADVALGAGRPGGRAAQSGICRGHGADHRPHRPRHDHRRCARQRQRRSESLATIQQLDPVYADFTQSANELLRAAQGAGKWRTGPAPGEAARAAAAGRRQQYEHPAACCFPKRPSTRRPDR